MSNKQLIHEKHVKTQASASEMDCYKYFNEQDKILNNKNVHFESKIKTLINIWNKIAETNLQNYDLKYTVRLADWAILHTFSNVLIAKWNSCKDSRGKEILDAITKAQKTLSEINQGFHGRCERLIYVVKVPWTHSILMNLMKTKDARIGSEEIEFFHFEQTHLTSIRLKVLCESRCQDLALNLVTAFITCFSALENASSYLNASEDQFWFMFDMHLALLSKFRHQKSVRSLLDNLTLQEGLLLVKRFYNKRVELLTVWKNCHKIALSATQIFMARAVSQNDASLTQYLQAYIEMCSSDNLLRDLCVNMEYISSIVNSTVIYSCCDVIMRKNEPKLRAFLVEMFVKGLTADMNELEHQKIVENDQANVVVIMQRLAVALCKLGQLFDEHLEVARECVLTAFSLEPTEDRLRLIESMAERSGFQISLAEQEWKCPLHPPALPSDDLIWKCPECEDWMCKPQLDTPLLRVNVTLNEAIQNSILGIPGNLCDDLIVCISNPRYQILKWHLPWNVLHRLCIMYLKDPTATKNLVTELKFIDIDYGMFEDIKREPLDEFAGIERGYEQYLDQNFVPVEDMEPPENIFDDGVQDYDANNSMGSLNKYLGFEKTIENASKDTMNWSNRFAEKSASRSILKKKLVHSGGMIHKKKSSYCRTRNVLETLQRRKAHVKMDSGNDVKLKVLKKV